MKQLVPAVVLSLIVGYVAGHSQTSSATLTPSVQAAQVAAPGPPAFPPRTLYWSADTLKKAHAEMVARGAARQTGGGSIVSVRTPTHGMNILHRAHHDKPVPSNTQKIMSTFDDAEAHGSLSEFLIFMGGTGTMVVDGEITNQVELAERPTEFRGQPIRNGTSYKVKQGDWMVIPPNTPHQPQPDPGGLTYLRMTINLTPLR